MSTLPAPVRDRLAELAREFAVAPPGATALAVLLERLARDDAAPTTVRDPARAVELHVADALAGLRVPELEGAETVADLGAGAGVPSLVLAAARPAMRVIAVEATGRKCAFIESLGAAMGLGNLAVVARRAEEWQAGREACDAVTARALAPLPVLAEYTAPLLRPGGALVAWKGEPDPVEERDGDAAAALLGLAPARRVSVAALPGAERRSLYVYVRTGSVPSGYPRRPGMARKRPIRAPEDAGK